MNWNRSDNKHYRGKIDRIYVSMTEYWEVDYFVQHYLESHNSTVNDRNREVVHQVMERYSGHVPIMRTDLVRFLDSNISFN